MIEDKGLPDSWVMQDVLWQSDTLRLEYSGPANPTNVVVAFAPIDHPFDAKGGWGAKSFAKRNMAHICVFHARPTWHQEDDFFEAMQACRAYVGEACQVVSYGFSMGGYAALLGAQSLRATRAVAISPQVSIDPKTVRFERRYLDEWAEMGPWLHHLRDHMDGKREYIVVYDPLHRLDSKHENRLPRRRGYRRVLMHGVGHSGIQACGQMGIHETLFGVLRGEIGASEMRRAFRARRPQGFRYVRKMGTLLHKRNHPLAQQFRTMAEEGGFDRLIRKWLE
jgi:hypothetical protein